MSTKITTASLKKDGNKNITANFKVREMKCNDGSDKILYCVDTVKIVQKIRDKFGPIKVSSAYRTPAYNKKVGGTSSSQHVKGRAMDIYPLSNNVSLEEMAKYAESCGAKGIMWYKTKKFIHIDTRDVKYFATVTNGKTKSVITFGGKPLSDGTISKSTVEATSNNKTKMKEVQKWLNTNYSAGLKVDGLAGDLTKKALVKAVQKYIGVKVDGDFGAKTKSALSKHTLDLNDTGKLVYILQGVLYAKGYNPKGFDGKFGNGVKTAVKSFQKANGLKDDGVVGVNTWEKLLK